jgi:hypothetical protein
MRRNKARPSTSPRAALGAEKCHFANYCKCITTFTDTCASQAALLALLLAQIHEKTAGHEHMSRRLSALNTRTFTFMRELV